MNRLFVFSLVFLSSITGIAGNIPHCLDDNRKIDVNNETVLRWKRSTPNKFLARGHVYGRIVRIYPNRNGHNHFSIKIGENPKDTIEVVYNQDFGPMPQHEVGDPVQACGDYITANARNGRYEPSPDGAIIHWVHINPSRRGHEDGFVVVDGEITGQRVPEDRR